MVKMAENMMIGRPSEAIRTADGAFVVGMDQKVERWGQSAEQILGLDSKSVIGMPCYEVMRGRSGRDHPVCRKDCPVMVNARRGRPTPNYDILADRVDGSSLWINMSIVLMNGDDENPPQLLHVFRDVTARRKLEERAERVLTALHDVVEEDTWETKGQEGSPRPSDGLPEVPTIQLSRRETQVLRLLAVGLTTGQIADSLGISPITARNHISRLLMKLGVQSRLQAVVYASQTGLV